MNDAQNQQNSEQKFTVPRNLLWGGAIAAIVIAFVLFLVIFMSSSETTYSLFGEVEKCP